MLNPSLFEKPTLIEKSDLVRCQRSSLRFASNKIKYLFLICAVVLFCLNQSIAAQSGRRPSKGAKPAPPPTVSVETVNAPSIPPPLRISSIVVTGKIIYKSGYSSSNYLDIALKECVRELKMKPGLEVIKGTSIAFDEAKDRAKKEINTFVLWIEYVTKDDSYGNTLVDYMDYAVLLPQTAKTLTNGRVLPGQMNVAITSGGVLTLPRKNRTSEISQMKEGAREIVGRLVTGGWLDDSP